MRRKQSYSKVYANALAKAITKQSGGVIPMNEANIVAIGIAKTLVKNGQPAALNTVTKVAKNIIEQKTRYENGELIYVPGQGVTDTATGSFYKEEDE